MSPVSSARSAGSTSEIESAVWPGVVTTRSSQTVDVDDLVVDERVGVEAVRRVERADRAALAAPRTRRPPRSGRSGGGSAAPAPTSPGLLVEPRRGGRPRSVPGRRPPTARRRARASTQVLVPSSVIIPGFGASRQRARAPNEPPAQRLGHQPLAGGQDRPQLVGDRQGPAVVRAARPPGCASRRSAPCAASSDLLAAPSYWATSSEVRYVGGISTISPRSAIATASAAGSQVTSDDSVDTSRVRCPSGQQRDEEPGAVALRLEDRGQPGGPDAEQVGAQHQPAAGQEVGHRQLARLQRDPVGLPVVAGGVRDHLVLVRSGQQHAGLLEGLADGGAHQRPRHLLVAAEPLGPLRRRSARPTPTSASKSRGSTPPPG